jgi:hypothetical protein
VDFCFWLLTLFFFPPLSPIVSSFLGLINVGNQQLETLIDLIARQDTIISDCHIPTFRTSRECALSSESVVVVNGQVGYEIGDVRSMVG